MAYSHLPTMAQSAARSRQQGGFSLLEVLIGGVLLGLALLTHAASTISEHRLARQQQVRSEALHAVRQFMGRLRADEDWVGLYARLLDVQRAPAAPADVQLEDGSVLRPPTTYFPDFAVGERLVNLRVAVKVPSVSTAVGEGQPILTVLREDANLPLFGLPADLDGDGAIGSAPLNDSYNALPALVEFSWVPTGEVAQQMKVFTWLRGDR